MAYKLSDLVWSEGNRRYLYPNGRLVPESQVNRYIKAYQAQYLQQVIKQTNELVSGTITARDWEQSVALSVKDAHVALLRFGRGGKDKTYAIHYLDVANELRANQYPALRGLVRDLRDGKLSRKMLDYRLSRFMQSSRVSYELGRRAYAVNEDKNGYAVRRLDAQAKHCEDCLRYARMGVKPLHLLPVPGQACRCAQACKCSIYYGNEWDLLEQSAGWLN
jgi:hypothetical protein